MPAELAQQLRESAVEDRIAAGRHRAEGVAMVSVVEPDEDAAPLFAALAPLLDGHLHRDLDRGRAVVGVEDPRQAGGGESDELGGQAGGRLVGEAGEDHLFERGRLRRESRVQPRVVVAEEVHPPGRDAVEDSPAVGELQPDPFGAHHRQRGRGGLHLGVGMPDVRPVQGEPVGAGTRRPHRGRRPRARAPARLDTWLTGDIL